VKIDSRKLVLKTPKPPIYITYFKNISPPIQLLEQNAEQQYEIKAVADNQVKVDPETYDFYRTITITDALNFTPTN
jgi:hypothetical protein